VLPEGFEVLDSDAYVVIDDLMDEVAVLAWSPGPSLGKAGRVSFAGETS
jgi:hypothetical protein